MIRTEISTTKLSRAIILLTEKAKSCLSQLLFKEDSIGEEVIEIAMEKQKEKETNSSPGFGLPNLANRIIGHLSDNKKKLVSLSLFSFLFCFVLFCFVLFCFVLFCFVLFCFVFLFFCFFVFLFFCFVFFVGERIVLPLALENTTDLCF